MRILILVLLFPLQLFSQELEGVWLGTIFNDTTRKFIPYEIVITESKGKFSGFSHTIFTGENNRQETGVKSLKIKKKAGSILIEDDELIFNNYDAPPPKGVRQYSVLNVIPADSGLMLIGVFNTNRTKEYSSLTGTIKLKKKEKFEDTKIIAKLDELKLAQSLSFVQAKEKAKIDEIAKTEKAIALAKTSDTKKDAASNINNEKTSLAKNETAENLIDINEDVIDYKVDVIETAEINKEKKKKQEDKKKTETVAVKPKIEPAPVTAKVEKKPEPLLSKPETVAVQPKIIAATVNPKVEKKAEALAPKPAPVVIKTNNLPVISNQPQKKEIVAVKKIEPAVTKEKVSISTAAKVTTQPSIPVQPDKKDIKTPVKKIETAVVAKDKPIQQPVFVQTGPVQKTIPFVAPLISAEEIAKRKIETIRTVDFKTDSLVLTLYDNGVVDGDTVSVILNGKVIISKQRLTTNAINKTIYTTAEWGDNLQLILYAENLGSIPPNTGLLIIQDGSEQYQIRFAGDLQKNSAIILRRKIN